MKNNILSLSVILALTLAAFWPSLTNGFTDWDDNRYISGNPLIRELSVENIKVMFTRVITGEGHYHPLTFISFALEYHFFELNPFIYHLDNLLIHLLNCILLYFFILKLAGCRVTAIVTAVLFAVHPMHVESVAWLPERKDVLSNAFYLGALMSYLHWIDRPKQKIKYYLICTFLFLGALLSKPSAVTLPLILLCCDYYKGRKLKLQALREKAPWFALSLIFGLFALGQKASADIAYSLAERLMFAGTAFWIYVIKVFYPFDLLAFYDFPQPGVSGYATALILAPWAAGLFVITVFTIFRKNKDIVFGSLIFLVTILPILGILRFSNYLMAERYTYFAYTGLFFIIARMVRAFIISDKPSLFLKRATLMFLFAFIGMCAWLTYLRCPIWNNAFTLWNDVLAKAPHSAFAYANRGSAYLNRGKLQEAHHDLTRAIELDGRLQSAFINRGNLYVQTGQLQSALDDYNNALLLGSDAEGIYVNRAVAFGRLKKWDKAQKDLDRALAINPHSAQAYLNRGSIHFDMGNYELAVKDYSRALEIDPEMTAAYFGRGLALTRMGRKAEADRDLLKASQHYKM